MTIVHCCPIFSELTQTFIYDLVRNMQDAGIDTRVLTWQRKNERDRPFEPVCTVPPPREREIFRLRLARMLPPIVEQWAFRPTPFERRLAQQFRQMEADLVHAHFGPTAVLVERACRIAGVPLVVTFRGRDASAKLGKWHWRRLYRRTLAGARAVAGVTPEIVERLDPFLPAECEKRTIFGAKQLRDLPFREPGASPSRAISIGRLIEKKGHQEAVQAIARAREMGIPATLTIVGEGPLRARLQDQIARLGLELAVTLAGSLPYEEVVDRLRGADLLIAANRTAANGDREGIPNVVKEALLVGLPVVGTRHGGIPWALPEAARGLLVAEGDVEGLACRIKELYHTPRPELVDMAKAGREHALNAFDPMTELREYLALYERATETGEGGGHGE